MAKPIIVNCPNCGKPITYSIENQYRPFCSERCKLIDLGAWAEEKYCIPENIKADDACHSSITPSEFKDF